MNGASLQEEIAKVFEVKSGEVKVHELKQNYRILEARFVCKAGGNETLCMYYASRMSEACSFKAEDGTCLYEEKFNGKTES